MVVLGSMSSGRSGASTPEKEVVSNLLRSEEGNRIGREKRPTYTVVKKNLLSVGRETCYSIHRGGCRHYAFFLDERYRVGEFLGQGSYAMVFGGEDTEELEEQWCEDADVSILRHKKVAIRVVPLYEDSMLSNMLREVRIFSRINHPFLLSMSHLSPFRAVPGPEKEGDGVVTMVMELMRGDVEKHVHNIFYGMEDFDVMKCKIMFNQMLRAVAYIHAVGVIHRDLKPANFLTDGFRVKLGDFGLARNVSDVMSRRVGTPDYRPPELTLSHKEAPRKCPYSTSFDMWSLGVILAELLGHAGTEPALFYGLGFLDDDEEPQPDMCAQQYLSILPGPDRSDDLSYIDTEEIRNFVKEEMEWRCHDPEERFRNYFPNAPEEALDLLRKLLEFNPDKRLSAQEALQHPFMADVTIDVLAEHLVLSDEELVTLVDQHFGKVDTVQIDINEDEIRNSTMQEIRELLVTESQLFNI